MQQYEIPAKGELWIDCEATVAGPGPFECPLTFWVHDGGIREMKVTVRGTGVAPNEAASK